MPLYNNNIEETLQKLRQEQALLEKLKIQSGQTVQSSVIDTLNQTIQSLTPEELSGLQKNSAYAEASKLYEEGFNSFLGAKFGNEYVETSNGRNAAENLINVLKQHKERFKEESQAKMKELERIAELVKNNPKIKAELDAMAKSE